MLSERALLILVPKELMLRAPEAAQAYLSGGMSSGALPRIIRYTLQRLVKLCKVIHMAVIQITSKIAYGSSSCLLKVAICLLVASDRKGSIAAMVVPSQAELFSLLALRVVIDLYSDFSDSLPSSFFLSLWGERVRSRLSFLRCFSAARKHYKNAVKRCFWEHFLTKASCLVWFPG